MHSSIKIAKEILTRVNKAGNTVTPMQLLKLVYIAHGWMLGLYGRPLISEDVHAWQYGPVIPQLYNKIKKYKDKPVKNISTFAMLEGDLTEYEEDILDQVYKKYGNYPGMKLSMMTHANGTPWYETWNLGHEVISNDLIEYYYNDLAQEKTA